MKKNIFYILLVFSIISFSTTHAKSINFELSDSLLASDVSENQNASLPIDCQEYGQGVYNYYINEGASERKAQRKANEFVKTCIIQLANQ